MDSETYLQFVAERHQIWERRQAGEYAPWTSDPVLRAKKFTNIFRVLDYGSQFLLSELIHGEDETVLTPEHVLMRCFLYRYTNTPEPWKAFQREFGHYPLLYDLESGRLLEFWQQYSADENPIFGPAYKMFVGQENKGMSRLEWTVKLTQSHFHPKSGINIQKDFRYAQSLLEQLEVLQTIPRCANFMSMQIATDFIYSGFGPEHITEEDTVILGPGAVRGAREIAPHMDPMATFLWAVKAVRSHEYCPVVPLHDGRVRMPSLMDIQNTFCEYSKYARYLRIGAPEKPFEAKHAEAAKAPPVLPERWYWEDPQYRDYPLSVPVD